MSEETSKETSKETGEETYGLRVERTVDAPREVVFKAWTESEQIKQWYHLPDGWSTPFAENDLRVGGAYRYGIHAGEAGTFYEFGEYIEITPPSRLVYTCSFECDECEFDMPGEEMLVTVELEDLGEQTRVVVRQEGYLKESDRDDQQNGWPGFLDHLAKFVAARAVS